METIGITWLITLVGAKLIIRNSDASNLHAIKHSFFSFYSVFTQPKESY